MRHVRPISDDWVNLHIHFVPSILSGVRSYLSWMFAIVLNITQQYTIFRGNYVILFVYLCLPFDALYDPRLFQVVVLQGSKMRSQHVAHQNSPAVFVEMGPRCLFGWTPRVEYENLTMKPGNVGGSFVVDFATVQTRSCLLFEWYWMHVSLFSSTFITLDSCLFLFF